MLVAVGVAAACSGDDATAGPDPAPTTTEAPRFEGDADSPFCVLLRDADVTAVLRGADGSPANVEAGFRAIVDVLDRAAEAAPSEVAEDAAVLADGMAALDEALAAVGYDFDVLAASPDAAEVTEAVNDPAFTVAGDRLRAYRTQVCRL